MLVRWDAARPAVTRDRSRDLERRSCTNKFESDRMRFAWDLFWLRWFYGA